MKKNILYTIFVTAILIGSFTLNVNAVPPSSIEWHSSLVIGTEISWRITDMSLVDPSDPPEIGYEEFEEGDAISFELNGTLPTVYEDLYETMVPPTFIKLFVGYNEVSFFDVSEDPGFALQYLVLPMLFYPYYGGIENITQFLDFRAARTPNVTSIDYLIVGDYIHADIVNDQLSNFKITINNNTGIVKELFVEDDFGYFSAELDIFDSDIDDYGVYIDNVLTWHSSLVPVTVLSYEFTLLDFVDPADNLEIGGHNASIGDIFKFKYINPIPTDPADYYGEEIEYFLEVYFKNELQLWDDTNEAQRVMYSTVLNPLNIVLYNGTTYSMYEIQQLREKMDEAITYLDATFGGDYMTLQMDIEWEEWDEYSTNQEPYTSQVIYTLLINVNTGILKQIDFNIIGMGFFQMVLNEEESSIDDYGVENTDFTENTETPTEGPTFSLPGFTWFLSSLILLFAVPIYRKKKK